MKRWRPLWSYCVEETEQWLAEMARDGLQLSNIQRFSRFFQFEKVASIETTYQIQYGKSAQLAKTLQNNGWQEVVKVKHWQIVKNDHPTVSLFPSRDGVLRRISYHQDKWSRFAIISALILLIIFIPFCFMLFMLDFEDLAPIWWMIPISIVILAVSNIRLSIFLKRQLQALEKTYFNTTIDQVQATGKTFRKWKNTWAYFPKIIERWLMKMAAQGNILVKVNGNFFIFEEGQNEKVSYACEMRKRVEPSYFDMHKEAGWHLKHKTTQHFGSFVIWAKQYKEGETIPTLGQDITEERKQTFRTYLKRSASLIFLTVLNLIHLLLRIKDYKFGVDIGDKTDLGILAIVAIVVLLSISISILINISYTYFFKERKLH
ncbi:DUF2812 domain-containing protein [Viridibacillus arvi]|uniref:DUF2812 domain-containing protein n=1 Tax=Viridibacillus arvi TaxID=263475 RepID=UPI003D029409